MQIDVTQSFRKKQYEKSKRKKKETVILVPIE